MPSSVDSPRRHAVRMAAVGGAVLAAWFALEIVAGPGLAMMGVHDDNLAHEVVSRHGAFVVAEQLAILGVYALVGALYGLGAAGALALWDRARGRARPRRRAWSVAAVVLAVHAWRVALCIIEYPQLFDGVLYGKGGFRRAVETTLTDHVPAWLAATAGWLAIAALVVGPALTARGRAFVSDKIAAARARARAVPRRARLATAGAASLAALVFLVAAHRSTEYGAAARDPRPNLLVIAVDSLRADRVLGDHPAAPHLAALARRGVAFASAYVSVPRTFPSWATILTGRWPAHHGIRTMFPSAAERAAVMAQQPALPSLLAAHGWRTAVVSDFAGEIFSRLDVGFEDRNVPRFDFRTVVAQAGLNLHPGIYPYAATALGHRIATSLETAADNADPQRLADRVIATVRDEARQGPFFVTAFFSTAHFPYAAPDPWYRAHTDPRYRGRYRYDKPPLLEGQSDADVTDDDVRQIRALYDGAVGATDAAIARVLDALDRDGLADKTIVVVLADHGESLYEAGHGMGHGEHLRGDAMLHIPLVVWDPMHNCATHRVDDLVRDVDLAPTLARLAGVDPAPLDADGAPLASLLQCSKETTPRLAFAETGLWFTTDVPAFAPDERLPYPPVPGSLTLETGDDIVLKPELRRLVVAAKHRMVKDGRWKLLYEPTRSGARLALFDEQTDPDDLHDVALQHADVRDRLAKALYGWMELDGSVRLGDFVLPRPELPR